ncbi:hypothetical protein ACFL31_04670 [Candidatus Margulisiibacteriota bacterium]
MTRVPRNRIFRDYREAMRHYEICRRGKPLPYKVKTPPVERDFVAHREFDTGELSIEASGPIGWGGSFGRAEEIWYTKPKQPRRLHNHPGLPERGINGATLSLSDLEDVKYRYPNIISSRVGMMRVSLPAKKSHLRRWPEAIEVEVVALNRRGRRRVDRIRIQHGLYERTNQMLERLVEEINDGTNGEIDLPSFMVSNFPVCYDKGNGILRGNVVFVATRNFRQIFRTFNSDPFAFLAPHAPWDHLFIG